MIWRSCYEGNQTWLNDVERGRQYAAGDAWGCFGRWFSGRWYTQPAVDYIASVQDYMNQRIWEVDYFQQP
jgi:autotransporter family porin